MKRVIARCAGMVIVATCIGVGVEAQTNYKIRQSMSMNGQKMETTVYVRGVRKRTESGGFMGMGGDVATIDQCDLKQTLKVNDKKRMYAIEPYDTGEGSGTVARPQEARGKAEPVTKGGTVTYIYNSVDTGERKTMFGVTARHIKTSMSMEASPDACSKADMKMESDGWYIDLPDYSCPMPITRPQIPDMGSRGGCQDKIQTRTSGSAKLGFPLTENRTMSMGGGMAFTQEVETLEFSTAKLDPALFDVPQGYSRATDSQQLYGQPDIAAMMRQAQMGNEKEDNSTSRSNSSAMNSGSSSQRQPDMAGAKKPGMIRIGVVVPTNKGDNVSTANLQAFLVERLTSGKAEAVSVGSEADAKAAGCDYILYSDISKLKQSTAGKIGGMFGKVTNLPGTAGAYDAQVDFKLISLATGQTVLQSKSTSKTETDAGRAAEAILGQEAASVLGAAK